MIMCVSKHFVKLVSLFLFLIVISFPASAFAIDTSNRTCKPWGRSKAKFLWASTESDPKSDIVLTLTEGPCGQAGETGKAYIFTYTNVHRLVCESENSPCENYSCSCDGGWKTIAVINVRGNQEAFKQIFPNGLKFIGDKWVTNHYLSTTVTQTEADYTLTLKDGPNSGNTIDLSASVSKFDAALNNTKFNIVVKFFLEYDGGQDPDCYCFLTSTTGSITVKSNNRADCSLINFKPDVKDGSAIAWIKENHRDYRSSGGQDEWSINYREEVDMGECDSATGWAGPVTGGPNKVTAEDFYRIKFPGWKDDVNGTPLYASRDGWSYSFEVNDKYICYDMGAEGKIYYHCNTPAAEGGSAEKYLLSKIEYCSEFQGPNEGTIKWNLNYEYNSPAKLQSIHNGSDPNSYLTGTKYYLYDWDSEDPDLVDVSYSLNDNVERQWQVAFDSEGRAVKYIASCSGGCGGGSGEFEHVEYYSPDDFVDNPADYNGFEDLIKKRFNSDGDTILENMYEKQVLEEYEDSGIYVYNADFEEDESNVPEGSCTQKIPVAWNAVDGDEYMQVCDPNEIGSLVFRPTGEAIEKIVSEITPKTIYSLEVKVRAQNDGEHQSSATVKLFASNDSGDIELDSVTVTEGTELQEEVWYTVQIELDTSSNTNIPEDLADSDYDLKLELSGNYVDIDNVTLFEQVFVGIETTPLLVSQKAIDPQSSTVKFTEWDYDSDTSTVTENRWISSSEARATKYVYTDESFTKITSKTEYEDLGDGGLPAGDSFETVYGGDDVGGIYETTYPSDNRVDFTIYGEHGLVVDSYIRDTQNDEITNRVRFEYEDQNSGSSPEQWEVVKQTNARGGVTEYEYERDAPSKRYLLSDVTEPSTDAGRQTIEYIYDGARRVIEQKRQGSNGNTLRTTYQYNSETGFMDSMTIYTSDREIAKTTYKYNDFGQQVRQTNPDGVVTGSSYGLGGELISEFVISENSNPNDSDNELDLISQTRFYYDDDGRLEYIKKVKSDEEFAYGDPDDQQDELYWVVTKYEYDFLGRRTKVVEDYDVPAERQNLTTTYEYNNQNEVSKITYPNGRWVETVRDGRGLITTESVGYGQDTEVLETTYEYDVNGNLEKQTNPDGTILLLEYGNYDRLEKTQKFNTSGPYSLSEYDDAGGLTRQKDYDSEDTMLTDIRNTYDDVGNLMSERILADPGTPDSTNDRITTYAYTIANQLKKTTMTKPADLEDGDPNEIITLISYDPLDRVHTTRDACYIETAYTYTKAGLVLTVTDPNEEGYDGFKTTNVYDAYGRGQKVINPEGDYTINFYNSLDQVYKYLIYDCNDTPAYMDDDREVIQTRFEYNNVDDITRQAVMKDPASSSSIDTSVDMVTDYIYDTDTGQLYQEKTYYGESATESVTTYYYDEIGRKEQTVDPVGNEQTITYYALVDGNPAQVEMIEQFEKCPDDSGKSYTITIWFTYDDYGNLYERIVDVDGDGSLEGTVFTTTYFYDDLDRLIEEVADNDIETWYYYDAFGNLDKTIEDPDDESYDGLNRMTEYGFDRLGRQVSVTAYDPNDDVPSQLTPQTTAYEYNRNDQVTKITYPDESSTEYKYNNQRKVRDEIQRNDTTVYYGYDEIGNLLWESDEWDPEVTPDFLTEYENDAVGNLIYVCKTVDEEIVADSEFEYNGFGLMTSDTTYLYTLDEVETTYTYDSSGNILTQTSPGLSLDFTHDTLGRIKTITKGQDQIVSYSYVGGNTNYIEYPTADVTCESGYDEIGRIDKCESYEGESTTILDLQYTYDNVSNRTSVKYNHLTTPVWDKYDYDNLGRLTDVEYGSLTGIAKLMDFVGDVQFAARVASQWISSDDSFIDLARQQLEYINFRESSLPMVLAQTGVDEVIRLYNDGDMPLLRLAEFGDDTEEDTTHEVYRDADGDILAMIVWDNKGRMILFTFYPNIGGSVLISISYDKKGNETSKTCTTYDSDGNIISVDDLLNMPTGTPASYPTQTTSEDLFDFGGGGMAMMSTPTGPEAATEEFDYDLLGNRYQYTDKNGYVSTYYHNSVNQYDQIHTEYELSVSYDRYPTYDENGNIATDENGNSYSYDYRNRLTSVTGIAVFAYDALGRRIMKETADKTTYYYYDPAGSVIAEFDDNGTNIALSRSFVYGNGIDEVLAMFLNPRPSGSTAFDEFAEAWLCANPGDNCYDGSYDDNNDDIIDYADFAAFADDFDIASGMETEYYYLHDALGSVMGIVGAQFDREDDREFYNYDVYGNPSDGISEVSNPYLFTSRRYDDESSNYYYRARTYRPSLGRFLQFDPIGYPDGMNLYEYVVSNPTNWIDPLGLAIYAFDGTGNNMEEDPKKNHTNVARFYQAYKKGYSGSGKNYYASGVGTRKGEKVWGNISGQGGQDRLKEAYTRLRANFNAGDTEIVIIGFSRGAALARAFANMINKGDPRSLSLDYSKDGKMPSGYCTSVEKYSPKVKFMGIFDTVGSFGAPGNKTDIGKDFYIPGNVQHAAHAVAQHERRKNFELTSVLPYAGYVDPTGRVVEQSFIGNHSDVGGGYEKNYRSRAPLAWMAAHAVYSGVSLTADNFDLSAVQKTPTGTGIHNSNIFRWYKRPHPIMTVEQVKKLEKKERTIYYYGKPKKSLRK